MKKPIIAAEVFAAFEAGKLTAAQASEKLGVPLIGPLHHGHLPWHHADDWGPSILDEYAGPWAKAVAAQAKAAVTYAALKAMQASGVADPYGMEYPPGHTNGPACPMACPMPTEPPALDCARVVDGRVGFGLQDCGLTAGGQAIHGRTLHAWRYVYRSSERN